MRRIVLMLFGFLILTAPLIAEDEESNPHNLYIAPAGSVRLCAGHVTGAPSPNGVPGAHISWEAYSSTQSVELLSKHYLKTLHSAAHSSDKDCHSWKSSSEHPDRILEVCDSKFKGVWSSCEGVPTNASSIILISTIARPE